MITEIGTKIYYLKTNGNIILETGDCRGYIKETTIEEDFLNYAKLKEYNREQVGVIQLKYGELNKLLQENKANTYTVDVSEEAKLVFKWIDPETQELGTPPPTLEDIIEKKVKEDVLVDVIKLLVTKNKKMTVKDVPPLASLDDLGLPRENNIGSLSGIDESDIPKLDPSMIPPAPQI